MTVTATPTVEPLDGMLVVDKPEGPTSHDVVARVRRLTGRRRVGHTGTLDPMATGVLPIVLGRATRLARFYSAAPKTYLADTRLGSATTTYDRLGTPLDPAPGGLGAHGIDRAALERALGPFQGTFEQTPPAFSAKKVGGRRAHALARRDRPVALAPVRVSVEDVVIEALAGDLVRLRLRTSAGFYVRSLAHDLGTALGCGAHLAALRRLASGDLTIERATRLEDLERRPELVRQALIGLESLVPWMAAVHLGDEGVRRVSHGLAARPIDMRSPASGRLPEPVGDRAGEGTRLLGPDGRLVAIAASAPDQTGALHPSVVLV